MSIKLLKTVNFGRGKKGLDSVGFSLFDTGGSISGSRSTSGVHEIGTNTGIYGCFVEFSNTFSGSILWDTGETPAAHAVEEYNGLEESVDRTLNLTAGRWKIDKDEFQMIFYKEDNVTEIARYDLMDGSEGPSFTEVFERRKV